MELEQYWQDSEWIKEHYSELQKKFTNKWVAIVRNAVVAIGDSLEEVRKFAQKKTGLTQIPVIFVESGENFY